ncbi:MAG: hypothetical protein COZ12_08805 [Deltaproteobacteria bacterium CG_4_10_14_3_um_filter_60_8]|nr:MAG: hypothetical protein AUK28_11210 [Desulfobacterales bacterium CG2_30_60_27]PIY20674.1 MAG: hypothetical protein COZ12_08805 [Deltaproteobacteria bacterium CG_4_10_14_3_um_filter_60_8]
MRENLLAIRPWELFALLNSRASAKVVIPVKTGIQKAHNQFNRLDSHLRGNDKKTIFKTFAKGSAVFRFNLPGIL